VDHISLGEHRTDRLMYSVADSFAGALDRYDAGLQVVES
jgi:hypothetical protein